MLFRSSVPVRLSDQHPETGSIPGSSTEKPLVREVISGQFSFYQQFWKKRVEGGRKASNAAEPWETMLGGEAAITPEQLGFEPSRFRDWLIANRDTFIRSMDAPIG
jgi:hypothetical protein